MLLPKNYYWEEAVFLNILIASGCAYKNRRTTVSWIWGSNSKIRCNVIAVIAAIVVSFVWSHIECSCWTIKSRYSKENISSKTKAYSSAGRVNKKVNLPMRMSPIWFSFLKYYFKIEIFADFVSDFYQKTPLIYSTLIY